MNKQLIEDLMVKADIRMKLNENCEMSVDANLSDIHRLIEIVVRDCSRDGKMCFIQGGGTAETNLLFRYGLS